MEITKGFKGFNKDLSCRDEKFEVGKIYYKEKDVENPRLCSTEGYHYCKDLQGVFNFYANENGNRFCEIEVLGNRTEEADKCITTTFRIVREISQEEIASIDLEFEKQREADRQRILEERLDRNVRIETVKALQEKYPQIIIGGSVALFLHGVRLDRFKDDRVKDLDLITPYYTLIESHKGFNVELESTHEYSDSCDFDEVLTINGVPCDLRIDNKQKYEIVTYKGIKYKVSRLVDIMEAKWRYAKQGNAKHLDDCLEMTKMLPAEVVEDKGHTESDVELLNMPF